MFELSSVWVTARYEARLLFRSWAFRIFSAMGAILLIFMNIGIGSTVSDAPHFFSSLSGGLPLMNIKLLNVYQGIIAAFMATEFIKRDRRHDTTQVIFARSFSNASYVTGKILGIGMVFGTLNLIVLAIGFIVHAFFSASPFAWQPYVWYTLLISLPTLTFMIGLSLFLITLFRSQALVFVLMLAGSLLSLILLWQHAFYIFDAYAFHLPIAWSDFIGLTNLNELLLLRGMYFSLGCGFIALTVLTTRRLRQTRIANIAAIAAVIVTIAAAAACGTVYLGDRYNDRTYRESLQALSASVADHPAPSVYACHLSVRHHEASLESTASLSLTNATNETLDSLFLSLNPGLRVSQITGGGKPLTFSRHEHLLWVIPPKPMEPGDSLSFDIQYDGTIDQRYPYLDIDLERYETAYRYWLQSVPKRYAAVHANMVHLTPECGWYPRGGLAPGAAFPRAAHVDFATYALDVETREGLTAISQGTVSSQTSSGNAEFHFENDTPLSQLSLTIGAYTHKQVEVDSISYHLYVLPSHDYYEEYFDEIADTLPFLIRELKNEYESGLKMEYSHRSLSLVEIPIQIFSYRRLWTVAQETVQPSIVYLPECGTLTPGADFKRMKRRSTRQQERANQAESPAQIQASYLINFAKLDLLDLQSNDFGIRGEENIEPRYSILPNYISHITRVSSSRWPVLNYAFESFFLDRIQPPSDQGFRFWAGLTDQEEASLALRHSSLKDLLDRTGKENDKARIALEAKGRFLLALAEAKSGNESFYDEIVRFLQQHQFRLIDDTAFVSFVNAQTGATAFAEDIDTWYADTVLPGYEIDGVQAYRVRDGERVRTQLKFALKNPTDADGLVEFSIRYRQQGRGPTPWWRRGQEGQDYTEMLFCPAQSVREVALLLDDAVAELSFDTYVSRNIPSVMKIPFREQELRRNAAPEESSVLIPIDSFATDLDRQELITDNEDSGFEIVSLNKQNWLRRTLLGMFGEGDQDSPYVGMRFWDPPGIWQATTGQGFYGKFIHSAYYKRSGDGESKVGWYADIADPGEYDVFFYYEGEEQRPHWFRSRGGGEDDNGERQFLVHHDDGIETLPVDLNMADQGWNYLGTFHLSAGRTRVEMTDKETRNMVTADAIKWVKR